jgi:RNA polymerase sigma-70 factor (ECF subfamily)
MDFSFSASRRLSLMNTREATLLNLAKEGEASAFQELLELHRGRLKRMVRLRMDRRLRARVDPSDVVQESMAQASAHRADFIEAPTRPLYAWLREIACNRLIDLHRRHVKAQRRSVTREESLAGPPASAESRRDLARRLADSSSSPIGQALRRELRERMRAALDELRPADREILVMRHLEELSVEEIADVLKISRTAVTSRQLRALQRLSRLVAKLDPS